MLCRNCGREIEDQALVCPYCRVQVFSEENIEISGEMSRMSSSRWITTVFWLISVAAGMIAGALMLLLGVSEEAADTLFDWYIDDETRCLLVGGGLAVFNYFLMKLFSKDWENM